MADFTDVSVSTSAARNFDALTAYNDQLVANFVDQYVFTSSVTLDSIEPTLANFSPADGSRLEKFQHVTFDITDVGQDYDTMVLVISVYIVSTDTTELAFNGETWENQYASSARSDIAQGFHFDVIRRAGWPTGGVRLRVRAVDRGGNVGVL